MTADYINDLNPEQRDAATTVDGFVRIIAGAGTGKTKTLVSRTAYLMGCGIRPENILLITFTKKAAKEMRDRVCAFIGPEGTKITATTFHSLCATLLRTYAAKIGFPADFQILNSSDSEQAMTLKRNPVREDYVKALKDEAMQRYMNRGLTDKEIKKKLKEISLKTFPTASQLLEMNSIMINDLQPLDDVVEAYFDATQDTNKPLDPKFIPDAINIIKQYSTYKYEHKMMDYDDLLGAFYHLLSTDEGVRSGLDQLFRYIMVDEYQDTNVIQDAITELLSKDVRNVCIVGDDNQSIYMFRGAKIRNIIDFDKRHPDCKTVKLIRNYRSTQEILDVSNAVMSYAQEGIRKDLQGFTNGDKPKLNIYRTTSDESMDIVRQIKSLKNAGIPYKETAVVARRGSQTFFLENELRKADIPFAKYGGKGFFELDAVVNVLSLVRAQLSEADELAWMRILNIVPGIGPVNAEKIYKKVMSAGRGELVSPFYWGKPYADGLTKLYETLSRSETMQPKDLINYLGRYYVTTMKNVIDERNTSDEKRMESLDTLQREAKSLDALEEMAASYTSKVEMLDDFILNTPATTDGDNIVTISTIHSVKGLEFHSVFLLDPLMGIFPYSEEDCPDTREDLRCMYVALTRAKKNLVVSYATSVQINGQFVEGELSCHLNKPEIKELFDVHNMQYSSDSYGYGRQGNYGWNSHNRFGGSKNGNIPFSL